jgi:hypothetical protein
MPTKSLSARYARYQILNELDDKGREEKRTMAPNI